MEEAEGSTTPREAPKPPPAAEDDEHVNPQRSLVVHFSSTFGRGTSGSSERIVEEEPKKELAWLRRGSVLGLSLHVIGFGFSNFVLLCTLLATLRHGQRQVMPCELGSSGLETPTEVMICEYTQAYMNTFPAIGAVVFCLTNGRDILVMRIYYGLLLEGGVMSFAANEAWRDWLIRFLVLNFLHAIGFIVIQFAALSRELDLPYTYTAEAVAQASLFELGLMPGPDDAGGHVKPVHHAFFRPHIHSGHGGIAQARRGMAKSDAELAWMCLSTMLPIVLLTVFLVLQQDIEKMLVPLSEYLKGYEERQMPIPSLHSIPDSAVKRFVENNPGPTTRHMDALQSYYKGLIRDYSARRSSIHLQEGLERPEEFQPGGDGVEPVSLFQALWPSKLLMQRSEDWIFRAAWLWYVTMSFAWLVFLQVNIIQLSRHQCASLFIGHRLHAIPPMIVVTVYSGILMSTVFVMARQVILISTARGAEPA